MKAKIYLPIAIFFYTSILCAQEDGFKLGKVTQDELNMNVYTNDSSASAVILFDKGYSYFTYDNVKERFNLMFERQLKIKFFKKQGFEHANFEIPLYRSNDGKSSEEIISLKGTTYNLVDGSIEKLKIDKSDLIIEETTENWSHAKFTFPGVKEGSIIELKYSTESPFYFTLQEWRFQYEIPVQNSKYSISIPEFFSYNKNMRGYNLFFVDEEYSTTNEKFLIEYKTPPQQGGVIEKGTFELESLSNYYTWVAKDIPAYVDEEYITTEDDYVSILEFELMSKQFPGQVREDYTKDWNSVNQKLIDMESFGRQLKISELIQKTADEITLGMTDKKEMAQKIYSFVQNEIKWDNEISSTIDLPDSYTYLGQYSKSYLENIITEKKGNSAEINLLLMMLLKSKNILCHPIILSTRSNGKVYPTHPSLSRYNYVIVEVIIGDQFYYLDAISDLLPFGVLSQRSLNGSGRRVISGTNEEVKIIPSADYSVTSTFTMKIDLDSGVKGTVNSVYKGYAAFEMREDIRDAGGEDNYANAIIKEQSLKTIEEYKIEGTSNINESVKESYVFTTEDDIIFSGDLIYLTPLLDERMKESPFKLDERKYPVDYAFKRNEKYIMQYSIPEGYEILEFPENVNMVLPEKAGSYQYQVSITGNILQVLSHFKINQPIVQYDLYPALKNFYNLVIEKQNQKIVLKKKV
jgi:hypothetical protein